MEKEFVPYELALGLKELGFDEDCLGYYGDRIVGLQERFSLRLDWKPQKFNNDDVATFAYEIDVNDDIFEMRLT